MNRTVHEIPRYEDARAALANPDLVPEMPEAPEAQPAAKGKEGASMAWLRASVPRFSSGETHARRRALVEAELARLDVARLRKAATRWPEAEDAAPYVVSTLAEALGYREPHAVAGAIGTVSRVYFGGEDPEADAAVARLVELLSPPGELVGESLRQPGPDGPRHPDHTELAAARICLLVQARDATAALVRHADAAPAAPADTTLAPGDAASADTRPIEQLLHETLRDDPPVRVLRRVAARDTRVVGRDIAAGDLVLLDATAAAPTDADAPLAFGAPPRVCPGREHAMALAAGALAHRRPSVTPFARLHRKDAPLLLPNAWDCASAAALAGAGFEAVGTTSLGVAAAAGLPDGAGVTADATLDLARRLGRTPLLFTVDMEGGFSDDPEEVADLARQLSAAGAAGINLEDGRADGSITPVDQHAAKIAAVKAAVPELFVNARTDTYWLGRDRADTEERLAAYQQAGADGLFVPGLAEPDRIRDIAARFELPLNILYSPTGPTLDELAALGVRRVSLGSLLYRTALGEAVAAARAVREGRRPTGDTLSYGEVQGL
ncbi:isocitrate lyase/phosphoenolpyruvate mutase family protein [Streptomyces sp. NBC_00006]|uniref:isocitrate lyase/phosphoenolpyruvate mutase family protein n=1 Tax=unclassified Streptomyces TaxID=2593676 RepID=UPI002256C50B|nr:MULTISPECIES: isocitrate lyase/phosphoenolpyruvate mutase family protein [unclassified Streptomyces]MCX5536920.1 isocitrate lyase/phosphoenolpyruvate mutase family protein [Streptomyces sp. NBC_00006]